MRSTLEDPEHGRSRSSDERASVWVFLFFVLLYGATAKGMLQYLDDICMLRVTESIVENGSFAVPPSTPGTRPGVDGRLYSQFGVGQSLLAVPFYVAGRELEKIFPTPKLVGSDGLVRASTTIYVVCLLGVIASALTVARSSPPLASASARSSGTTRGRS